MASSSSKSVVTRSGTQKKLFDVVYSEIDEFPPGKLPLEKSVIERMLFLMRPDRAEKQSLSTHDAARAVAKELQEHWHYCNIYTCTMKAITEKLQKHYPHS